MDFFGKFLPKTPYLRAERATRVIFYYSGEEPTYLDDAEVVLYSSGVVDIFHPDERVTTHIQNVEIIWDSRRPTFTPVNKSFRLVKNDFTQTH